MKHLNGILILTVICVALSSCDTGKTGSTDWYESVSLETNKGSPGDKIGIKGIPTNPTTIFANVTVPSGDAESVAIIEQNEQGASYPFSLIVPIHPVEYFAGGKVNIEVSDGEKSCSPVELTITSMGDPNDPEIKGTFTRMVSTLQQSINDEAETAGITVETLKGKFSGLSQEHIPLAVTQFLVDHPDNPNSLIAIANRGTILMDENFIPVDKAWLDVLFYHFQLSDSSKTSELATLAAPPTLCIGEKVLSSAEHLK